MSPRNTQRRALGQHGGAITTTGDAAAAAELARAFRAQKGDGRLLTHGCHPYPARAHPLLVRSLLESFATPGQVILDPFLGSGTVAVEAMAAGCRALGCDIHPVALLVARVKTERMDGDARWRCEEAARSAASRARRAARERVDTSGVPEKIARWFAAGALRELLALRAHVAGIRQDSRRRALLFVLSSLLIKFSRRAAETDERPEERAHPQGAVSRFFLSRTTELALAMRSLRYACPHRTPPPLMVAASALALPFCSARADLIITSPPYLGRYDYARFQELRRRFLGLENWGGEKQEIGSRSRAARPASHPLTSYRQELAASLGEMRRVLRPGAHAILILGDATASPRGDSALLLVRDAARSAGLAVLASASQPRPGGPRTGLEEHLIALRR